jgi:hypothetical protein
MSERGFTPRERKIDPVALAHGAEALGRVVVETGQMVAHEGHQDAAQELAARHPLVIVPSSVVVRSVQAALGEHPLQPPEEPLVADVHAQRDLGLPAVAAEVPFADEEADEEPGREVIGRPGLPHGREGSHG